MFEDTLNDDKYAKLIHITLEIGAIIDKNKLSLEEILFVLNQVQEGIKLADNSGSISLAGEKDDT